MARWMVCLLLLGGLSLLAQRPAPSPLETFERRLKANRQGAWLVLEDEGAAWGTSLGAALEEDPLATLNLPLKVCEGGKKPEALAPFLRERYGWPRGAHWALLDPKGRVLFEGASAPTLASLTAAVEQVGIRTKAQELEDFLRQNPDHLEARVNLVRELITVATRRTQKKLGKPAPPPPEPVPGEEKIPAVPVQPLDAETDLKLWSQAVQQLDGLFQRPWQEVGLWLSISLRGSAADRSPSMQALLTRYKGEMETSLRRAPTRMETWQVWLAGSRACGGWALSPLLQSLEPVPGTGPEAWPPWPVLGEFVKDAKARQEWAAIREVMEARWELLSGEGNLRGSGPWPWNTMVAPLVEALLAMGDAGAADRLVGEANGLLAWQGLPEQAKGLATRWHRPELAARWAALTVPKGR